MSNHYSITLVSDDESTRVIPFTPYEYNNLMELLFDQAIEEWGDCKGRAMCGTCHIEILEGDPKEEMELYEQHTIDDLPNKTPSSRLACQLLMTPDVNNLMFRILKDY